jgi:bacterial/archaeal transporter family-2 protein
VAIWPYLAFGFLAGAMLPVQFGINAQLADWVGSPLRATLVSFGVGTVALLAATLVFVRGWPGGERLGEAPWWVWLGGLLGAFYVLGSVVTAPKLGAATLVAVILAGQAVASLLVDHFGWVGFEENPVTPGRLVGMALVAVGVALVRAF